MVEQVRSCYPKEKYDNLEFRCMSALDCSSIGETFDTIILVNSINEITDVSVLFEELKSLCTSRTRVVQFWLMVDGNLQPLSINSRNAA